MKTALIINPKSASGNTMKLWREVKSQLQARIPAFEVFMTEFPRHATEITQHLCEKQYERIIVMGGDGSLHEVVNGLFDADGKMIQPNIKLGILNSGRGCDFIKSLDIPTDCAQNINILVDSKVRHIDLGKITFQTAKGPKTEYYLNSFSYGLGGDVAGKVMRQNSFLPPSVMYFTASVSGLFASQPTTIEIELPNKPITKKQYINVFAMCGKYSGGGMNWAARAKIDDGLVDIVLVHKMSKLKLALSSGKVYEGKFDTIEEVEYIQAPWVHFKAEKELPMEMDGEVTSSKDVKIEILPKILQFIC